MPRPNSRSLEYRLTWGLASIRADRAYAAGSNGSGVIVAMIDAGMTAETMGLFGNVSPASVDLIKERSGGGEGDSHARQTAALLAAPFDGKGTLGVAYGAQLLSIRIDADGSCANECYARAVDLARGIDYALDHGAKVIGVPMIGRHRLTAVEPALARAAAEGAVIVTAAGNDGWEEVAWPARYALDPELRDAILIVGASTFRGEAAAWSNKAGRAAGRYLVAPGENLLVDCGERTCALVSGTSYAVPYAAGALSLVMGANPHLTAQQAADILIASARDRGARGVDRITGAGLVDVGQAMRAARKQNS